MKIIATVDNRWGIGYNRKALVSIPADMRFLNTETLGKVIVMSRSTMEALPGGRPLKNRTSFVLTRETGFRDPEAIVVHSLGQLKSMLEKYDTNNIYIVGGEYLFNNLLNECDVVYLTKVDFTYQADAFFPNLDESKEWVLAAESDEDTYYDMDFRTAVYVKR